MTWVPGTTQSLAAGAADSNTLISTIAIVYGHTG